MALTLKESIDVDSWTPPTFEEIAKGYRLVTISDYESGWQPRSKLTNAMVQLQTILEPADDSGCYQLDISSQSYEEMTLQDFPHEDIPLEYPEVETALERVLSQLAIEPRQKLRYIVQSSSNPEIRKEFGLPTSVPHTSSRLLRTRLHVDGVHTPDVLYSEGYSFACFHREDFNTESALWHWGGKPKVWLTIPPRHAEQFEACVSQYFNLSHRDLCSQFVRHPNLVVLPSQLRKWGIDFNLVVHRPGQMIWTLAGLYHAVWNLGPNLAEALNICGKNWLPPPLYRPCVKAKKRSSACGPGEKITFGDMTIDDSPVPTPMMSEYPGSNANPVNTDRTDIQAKKVPGNSSQIPPKDSQSRDVDAVGPSTIVRDRERPYSVSRHAVTNDAEDSGYGSEAQSTSQGRSNVQKNAVSSTSGTINLRRSGKDVNEEIDRLITMAGRLSPWADDLLMGIERLKPGQPGTGSWLNSNMVFMCLQAVAWDRTDVVVLEPLNQETLGQNSSRWAPKLRPTLSINTFVLPMHYNNHWLLVTFQEASKTATMYDDGEKAPPGIRKILITLVNRRWKSKWKWEQRQNLDNPTESECGVLLAVLLKMELKPQEPIERDLTMRRLWCLQMLVPDLVRQVISHDSHADLPDDLRNLVRSKTSPGNTQQDIKGTQIRGPTSSDESPIPNVSTSSSASSNVARNRKPAGTVKVVSNSRLLQQGETSQKRHRELAPSSESSKKLKLSTSAVPLDIKNIEEVIREVDKYCHFPAIKPLELPATHVWKLAAAVGSRASIVQFCALVKSRRDRNASRVEINSVGGDYRQIERRLRIISTSQRRSLFEKFVIRLNQFYLSEELEKKEGFRFRNSTKKIQEILKNSGLTLSHFKHHQRWGKKWKHICGDNAGLLCFLFLESNRLFGISPETYLSLNDTDLDAFHLLLKNPYMQAICQSGLAFIKSLQPHEEDVQFRWEEAKDFCPDLLPEVELLSSLELIPALTENRFIEGEYPSWPTTAGGPLDPTSLFDINNGHCEMCPKSTCMCVSDIGAGKAKPRIKNYGSKGRGIEAVANGHGPMAYKRGELIGQLTGNIVPVDEIGDGWRVAVSRRDLPGRPIVAHIHCADVGNYLRLMNSDRFPSARFRVMKLSGRYRMMVEATSNIYDGQEITVDYGKDYLLGKKWADAHAQT